MEYKIRSITVDDKLWEALKQAAKCEDTNVSRLIRLIARDYLAND